MSGECDKCGEHCLDCICDNYFCPPAIQSYNATVKIRKYKRMNEKEQKATGYPTDNESISQGISPIEISLGYDPFITHEEVEGCSVCKNESVTCVCMRDEE